MRQQGHQVVAYDNLTKGHRSAVDGARLMVGDISDTALLTSTLRDMRADAIMHFAAEISVEESVIAPKSHYRNNIYGTMSVLDAMRDANVPRILFSSTCAVYGTAPQSPMAEDATKNPYSPYARTKLAVEWMIQDYSAAYGFGCSILRYFNAAGASKEGNFGEDHAPESHLIPIVLQVHLKQRGELRIYGNDYPTPDGTCIRDYIHVDDLAAAHHLTINATEPGTQSIYNVGTGLGTSVIEIMNACEDVTGQAIPHEIAERRPGDAPILIADPSKIVNELGWKPKHRGIKPIIETAWKWHRKHPDGY